jgi:hypothetical protein
VKLPARLVLLAIGFSAFGCQQREQTQESSAGASISAGWIADTGLSLRAFAVSDTVRSPNDAAVVLMLHSGGAPVVIRNHPSYYSLQVVDSDGRELTPDGSYYESPVLGRRADVTLPRNGLLGQVLGLWCALPPFDPVKATNRCMWRYPILNGSTYQIAARYRVPQVAIDSAPPPAGLDLQSNTVRIHVQRR